MNITIDQLEYDKEVIVNKKQYLAAMSDCAGLVAGREENGIYYIKVWLTKYKKYILSVLTHNN